MAIKDLNFMKKLGKPVSRDIEKFDKKVKTIINNMEQNTQIDFKNTANAFQHKSDAELKKAAWLFGLMNRPWLVGIGSQLGIAAIRLHLPFVTTIVKNTIFEQFCGGTSLETCQKTVDMLGTYHTATILDYGAEAKETEEELDVTRDETIRAIKFASKNSHVPVVSTKISGLASTVLLEAVQENEYYNASLQKQYKNVIARLNAICKVASKHRVGVFFDAEESWLQDAIDHFVNLMMEEYNEERVIVYNTFQMYRNDRLNYLRKSFRRAEKKGYMLGAKLVRGAYMEKERERAKEKGYPSPIHPDKASVDIDYNKAVKFVVDNYEKIASCNASHNEESALLQARLIEEKNLPKNHPHLNFCQLYGMSDHITFNLAEAGYNVAKYVPYGKVRDVVPYLIRRAQENSSVTGDMGREYALVLQEMKRRGL